MKPFISVCLVLLTMAAPGLGAAADGQLGTGSADLDAYAEEIAQLSS